MSDFAFALKALEEGHAVRRRDWSYGKNARLVLLSGFRDMLIYIQAPYSISTNEYIEGYGLQYADLKSTEWEIVE